MFIEYLAIGQVVHFKSMNELELQLLLPEDNSITDTLYVNCKSLQDLKVNSYVLVRCYSYPGEESSSINCEIISLLTKDDYSLNVIPMEEENVCCDLKGNKYLISPEEYMKGVRYAQGYLNIGFRGLPKELSAPLYLPDGCVFTPYGIDAYGTIDACIYILGGQVPQYKEQSDYRLILVRLLEFINSKKH